MTAANAMMRLMSERGVESQQDRYARIQKDGIKVFDMEMKQKNIPQDIVDKMHYHCDQYYGCCAIQEQMMEILMDVAGFTLGEANSARKIVGKKQMDKIPQLQEKVLNQAKSKRLGEYIWKYGAGPQMGYSFSIIHALAYSFIGAQARIRVYGNDYFKYLKSRSDAREANRSMFAEPMQIYSNIVDGAGHFGIAKYYNYKFFQNKTPFQYP